MSSSRENRQRAAARARLERQMAERREAARRRRVMQARIAGGVAGLVLLGAAIWIIVAVNSGGPGEPPPQAAEDGPCAYPEAYPQPTAAPPASGDPSASADPSATLDPSPTADPSAQPTATPSPLPEGIQDVGFPDAEPPRSGFQVLTFETNLGTIQVEMDLSKTPCTSNSLAFLANQGFYDNTSCHRIVPEIYALQCGDPSGTGFGGPNYTVADENLPTDQLPAYREGDVAMANAGPDTNGSQFFFVYGVSSLPGNYPLWGRVISGFDVIQQVAAGGSVAGTEMSAGGGTPAVSLTFTKVTAGPVSPTPSPTPSPTATPTPSPTPSPTETASPTTT